MPEEQPSAVMQSVMKMTELSKDWLASWPRTVLNELFYRLIAALCLEEQRLLDHTLLDEEISGHIFALRELQQSVLQLRDDSVLDRRQYLCCSRAISRLESAILKESA